MFKIKIKVFLTERQIEVYELYKSGLTQVEIARKLNTTQPNISQILHSVEKEAPGKVRMLNKSHKYYEYEL